MFGHSYQFNSTKIHLGTTLKTVGISYKYFSSDCPDIYQPGGSLVLMLVPLIFRNSEFFFSHRDSLQSSSRPEKMQLIYCQYCLFDNLVNLYSWKYDLECIKTLKFNYTILPEVEYFLLIKVHFELKHAKDIWK